MDEISDKLSALLNDPAGMEKIKGMAQSLFGGEEEKSSSPLPDMARLLPIINKFSASSEDSRVRLIMSLRPYLSAERQKKADKAVKILKAAALVPLISESGLFDF
ncbi:MAG: hypothetical protein KBS52_02520 [Clostridiales bacterium]|nr:hypothetical protein [Candidatus Equinaster intestinalis]